jgi:hypothetical protein
MPDTTVAFRPLLDVVVKGTYFLRHELVDYTSEEGLKRILAKVDELVNAETDVITPIFTFSEQFSFFSGTNFFCIDIWKEPKELPDSRMIGKIYLDIISLENSKYKLLELNTNFLSVAEKEISLADSKQLIKDIQKYLSFKTQKELIEKMCYVETVMGLNTSLDQKLYTLKMGITNKEISITVYKNGVMHRTNVVKYRD